MNIDAYTSRATGPAGIGGPAIDAGLRRYMLSVYNYMAAGVGLTGLVAYLATATGFYQQIAGTPLIWLVMLAPLAAVLFLSLRIDRMSFATAQAVFWAYSGLVGLSLAGILLAYTGTSIARVFFISAGTFAAMSLYGYSTGRDLSRLGSFLFMGLIGIVLASVVNIFVASSMLHFVTSIIGVLVFTGLTAYDTQRIKQLYYAGGMGDLAKTALMGALTLYLDAINLFVMLLNLSGDRRAR
ncbi:Bax inhibitor-1/YccA family protein [Rhodopila sp.]|uniref:Bax inhibitor-1/YccA family protein n=1 Tax=Rhodopila sp. TaxID=2480087 RepID=UPI003D0F51B3